MSAEHDGRVDAELSRWPTGCGLADVTVALLMIDFQHDFCSPGGFADRGGFDIAAVQPARAAAGRVLTAARDAGWTVVHTRVGRPATIVAPETEHSTVPVVGAAGPLGRHLVRGEPGYETVDDLAPIDGEVIIDKLGKGAFHGTELDLVLRRRGVTHLVFAGVTSDVCVLSTFREAHDREYSSLVLTDATGSYSTESHDAAMTLVTTHRGILGCRAPVDALLTCMPSSPKPPASLIGPSLIGRSFIGKETNQ